jgi:hypothetical protein
MEAGILLSGAVFGSVPPCPRAEGRLVGLRGSQRRSEVRWVGAGEEVEAVEARRC